LNNKKRYVITKTVTVVTFLSEKKNEPFERDFFITDDVKVVTETIKDACGEDVANKATYTVYRKGDALEKVTLNKEEEFLFNINVLKQRTIQESIKLKDGTVKEI